MDNNLSPEDVATIAQSPRSADVTDVEDLCDAYVSQAAKIAELERENKVGDEMIESREADIESLQQQATLYEDANGQLEAKIAELEQALERTEAHWRQEMAAYKWRDGELPDTPPLAGIDQYAIHKAFGEYARRRTSMENILDVLDAISSLLRPTEPRDARRDIGIKDQYGKPLLEGDLVRVNWLADIGITELDLEREGIVTYMPDGFTAAWFVKFDPPLHMGVCEDGTFTSEGEMLCQTSEGDDYTHHFTKLPAETSTAKQTLFDAVRVVTGHSPRCATYADFRAPCTCDETGESK